MFLSEQREALVRNTLRLGVHVWLCPVLKRTNWLIMSSHIGASPPEPGDTWRYTLGPSTISNTRSTCYVGGTAILAPRHKSQSLQPRPALPESVQQKGMACRGHRPRDELLRSWKQCGPSKWFSGHQVLRQRVERCSGVPYNVSTGG